MDHELWQETLKVVVREGFFVGLERLRQEGKLSASDVGKVRASMFEYLTNRVAESQREVHKIQAVLGRLHGICRAGMNPSPLPLVFSGPVNRLGPELQALDGWVVSLYETDLTMVGVLNPTTRRQHPQAFAQSMDKLWQKREVALLGVRDVSLFADVWGT
jgi:hypothetical protein